MIFDTDIFIWIQRGNLKAANFFDSYDEKKIAIYSYMELLQGAKDKIQNIYIKKFLHENNIEVVPLTERIGHRAAVYIEEYSLSHGLKAGDAIIAATAVENTFPLATSNAKHFQFINELDLKIFKP